MGTEPSPTSRGSRQSLSSYGRSALRIRTLSAVARLAGKQSISDGNELGQQSGSWFPKHGLDVGVPSARRHAGPSYGLSPRVAQRPEFKWKTPGALSLNLLFA